MQFPNVSDTDIAFGIMPDKKILANSMEFYNKNTKYNQLFSELFFKGGTIHYKEILTDKTRENNFRYLKAVMGSFQPKHEQKDAVCAFILSKLVDIDKYDL